MDKKLEEMRDKAAEAYALGEGADVNQVAVFTVDRYLGNHQQYEFVKDFSHTAVIAYKAGFDAAVEAMESRIYQRGFDAAVEQMEAALAQHNKIATHYEQRISDLIATKWKLEEALKRIKGFNPSYEYTFENARSIASEALADGGGV